MYQIVKQPTARAKGMTWITEERLGIYTTKEDAERAASQVKTSVFWHVIICLVTHK